MNEYLISEYVRDAREAKTVQAHCAAVRGLLIHLKIEPDDVDGWGSPAAYLLWHGEDDPRLDARMADYQETIQDQLRAADSLA